MPKEFAFREATRADIPVLVAHRRCMFEDMAKASGSPIRGADFDAMETAYAKYLRRHLSAGSAQAWIAEASGVAAGSGAVTILPQPPCPGLAAGHTAFLYSMYTLPQFRRRGVARRIVEMAIAYCRGAGCQFMILGGRGTDAGRPLYEKLGFKPREDMRLHL